MADSNDEAKPNVGPELNGGPEPNGGLDSNGGVAKQSTESQSIMPRRRIVLAEKPDYFLFGLFVCIWLLPISYTGFFQRPIPGVGIYPNDMYRVASLFTTRLKGSVAFYIQFQSNEDFTWQTVPKSDYAKIIMSGNRTRLDRVLADSMRSPRGMAQRQQIAEFVKRTYEAAHPDAAKIDKVRYLAVLFPVGEEQAKRKGRWVQWPLDRVPGEQQKEVSVHFFDGRSPIDSFENPPEDRLPE